MGPKRVGIEMCDREARDPHLSAHNIQNCLQALLQLTPSINPLCCTTRLQHPRRPDPLADHGNHARARDGPDIDADASHGGAGEGKKPLDMPRHPACREIEHGGLAEPEVRGEL